MTNSFFPKHMINSLFPKHYFTTIQKDRYLSLSVSEKEHLLELFQNLQSHIRSVLGQEIVDIQYVSNNEEETKSKIIEPILKVLGYHKNHFVKEESFKLQGQNISLDYLVHSSKQALEDFRQLKPFAQDDFVFIEAKAYGKPLDTKKSDKDNPHIQVLRYANSTGISYSILTNGTAFRFYDHSQRTKKQSFFEITLEDVEQMTDVQDFYIYFYGVFGYDTLIAHDKKASSYQSQVKPQIEQHQNSIKDKLSDILYGMGEEYESVIEKIGQFLDKAHPNTDLKELFHNSLILIFRILFMASYETRYQNILEQHQTYKQKYSLLHFVKKYAKEEYIETTGFLLWGELLTIFEYLDKGNERYKIPMLNGGLFSPTRAPLLEKSELFDNIDLWALLKALLIDATSPLYHENILDRFYDFRSLDTTTFGEIYEVSLSYDFRRATEKVHLVQYTEKNTLKTVTLDHYDYEKTRARYKNHKNVLEYNKGDLYLTSLSGERKRTGSYYTPEIFANFLVKTGIDSQIQGGKNPLDLKIIDNSCGSGHFLLYSLFYLCQKVQDILIQGEEPSVSKEISALAKKIRENIELEKGKITQNITSVVEKHTESLNNILLEETSDEKIIRRLILKRCLFGVDLQEVAVEITMISLWMETFIFATPLSFIEHHIKVGNSLLYMSMQEMEEKSSLQGGGLFLNHQLEPYRQEMKKLLNEVAQMRDTTPEEIKKSKDKYYHKVEPEMVKMREIFNYFFYEKWITLLHKHDPKRMVSAANEKLRENRWRKEMEWIGSVGATLDTIRNLLLAKRETNKQRWDDAILKANGNIQKIRELVVKEEWKNKWDNIKAQYPLLKPFHVEIEFPDVPNGFDVVVGNPPWDKVQFGEDGFYSRLDTNYRTLPHSGKLAIRERYTYNTWVQELYQTEQQIDLYNIYLQNTFPSAKGGQGNLFRYFVARNLGLMAKGGTLSYLTPSALMMEDASTNLRKHILEHYTMHYFYQFENRAKYFGAVDSRFKIALWQIQNILPQPQNMIQTRFLQNDVDFLSAEHEDWQKSNILYTVPLLKQLSPDHWRFLELKAPIELELFKRVQHLFQPLAEEYIQWKQELNMTLDRELFQELHLDNTFDKAWRKEDFLPLYEGKMIHQYQAQYKEPQYWVEKGALEAKLKGRMDRRTKESSSENMDWDYRHIRLAFREVASNTNERTVISSLVPEGITFGNTMWLGVPLSLQQGLFLQSIFNSLVFDFMARLFVEMTVSKSLMMRLPCPQPPLAQLNTEPYKTLVACAAQLQVLNNPGIFPEIEAQFGIDPKKLPHSQNAREKRQDQLRVQIDVLVAQLYQITPDEMAYMLTTFPVFNKKNPHYRKLLLEAMKPTTPDDTVVEYDF